MWQAYREEPRVQSHAMQNVQRRVLLDLPGRMEATQLEHWRLL